MAQKAIARFLARVAPYDSRYGPHGLRLSSDLARRLPHLQVRTVFDVGANVGQSVTKFLAAFPEAQIYAFEPGSGAYRELASRFGQSRRVRCEQLAMGSAAGSAAISIGTQSTRASLVQRAPGSREERVPVETIDGFCRTNGVERIDLLKIDTEGFDLEVLRGAEAMLRAGAVEIVQAEAGMNPENTLHQPLQALMQHLEERRYFLFGFYDQKRDRTGMVPYLRRADAAFIRVPKE